MSKEQIKEKIEERIRQLEAEKNEYIEDYKGGELPTDFCSDGIHECVNGICELEEILKLF